MHPNINISEQITLLSKSDAVFGISCNSEQKQYCFFKNDLSQANTLIPTSPLPPLGPLITS